MTGASVAALFNNKVPTEKMLCGATIGSAVMVVPGWIGMSEALTKYNLWAFVAFEFCVGIYFPAICTLKSETVPESHRATIYNLFRAPMNAIVVAVLLANPDLMRTFQLVCSMLLMSALTAGTLLALPDKVHKGEGL